MNRVKVLCAMNRTMLKAFSQHTVEGLKSHTLFRLALPPFQSFLDINVDKEVKKDRSIIALASSLVQSKSSPGPDHVSTLLQEARRMIEPSYAKQQYFLSISRSSTRTSNHTGSSALNCYCKPAIASLHNGKM